MPNVNSIYCKNVRGVRITSPKTDVRLFDLDLTPRSNCHCYLHTHEQIAPYCICARAPLSSLAEVSSRARGLNFGQSSSTSILLYMGAGKSLASRQVCAGSPEPLLLDSLISTKTSCACSF